MKTLTTEDAFFLYIETPDQHQHTITTLIIDPAQAPADFSIERLVEKLEQDIHIRPQFCQRLVNTPFSMTPPVLVDDPYFAFKNHVHQIAAPAPGGMRQLTSIVEDIAGVRLSRRRPLWDCWFVSGLEQGRIAIIFKAHHCLADAISGMAFLGELFDIAPEAFAGRSQQSLSAGADMPNLWAIVYRAILSQWRYQPRYHEVVGRTFRSLQRRRSLISQSHELRQWVPAILEEAPRLKFNAPITPHRSCAMGSVPLDDIRAIRQALDMTINDVITAACTLALREYLIATDDLPDRPLICYMPVSLALKGRSSRNPEQSNHVGNMAVRLPVQIEDPAELAQAVKAATGAAKQVFDASFENLFQGYLSMLPPYLADWTLKQALSRQVVKYAPTNCNLVISNFPGPTMPLYLSGAHLAAVHCMGPTISGQGPNITFMSYADQIHFSILACREHMPDLWQLADGITRGFDALRALAGVAAEAVPAEETAEPAVPRRQAADRPARPRIVVRDVITV